MQTNQKLELADKYVQYTRQHIFLTGKAGTGKTTFLHSLREKSLKRMIVVAPTGVAAINARGVTIHSFFQLPFGMQLSADKMNINQMRMSKEKINIIRSLDLLVIDEISMVRADLLDAIDFVLRRIRGNIKPFGGVQLLMIGDLQQLAPVVKDDEREILNKHYDTPFFFSSKVLRETSFISIELTHVFRQQDGYFISILNNVRENNMDKITLDALNQRYIPDFKPKESDGYITLCTHNAQVQRINENKLTVLNGKAQRFKAKIEGAFPEHAYPTEFELIVKENAQVMFVKNDSSPEKRYYNGKIGKITSIKDDIINVICAGENEELSVTPVKWDNVRYSLNETTNEIVEEIDGSFIQYPLKLAWAITIHKSQGLTFEHAIIDAQASFAHGQVYVALSRCKTLEGLVLSTPIRDYSVISDKTVSGFNENIKQNQSNETTFETARIAYQHELLDELFAFGFFRSRISYIEKIINENKGSIPESTKKLFQQLNIAVKTEIIDVADKFLPQIKNLLSQQSDVEKNDALQKRIIQASKYFSDKVKINILDAILKADTDIDNKAIKKSLNEAVSRLDSDARVKYECFVACDSGFNLATLLNAKAVATIEKEKPKATPKFAAVDSEYIAYPALFNQLRAWRTEKAAELNRPAFFVFSQKELYDLVNYLPADKKTLKQINGFGDKKIDMFGSEIIEIIQKYCEDNNIDRQMILREIQKNEPETKIKTKQTKEDTKLVSFNLFGQGKSIAEIAAERGFAQSTIEEHLAHFVAKGKITAQQLIVPDKLKKIIKYFEKADTLALSTAKIALGNDISYGELKIGMAQFLRQRAENYKDKID
ncbi:MAG: HRDC domain-containing protein [Prevotellaceae bacterium]|jgi:dephospho-CoA kinase|nr:HRDC domain-containing protein [Prevotellaceae bacterium]